MSGRPATVKDSPTTQRDRSFEKTTMGPDVLAWIDWLEIGGFADGTLDQYERDISRLCKRFPRKKLQNVTDADLLEVLRTFPPKSRRVRKAAYDSFFKWAIRTRRIEKNPCDLLPSVKRSSKRYIDTFSDAEVEDLLTLPVIDSALMAILVEAGLRKAEARALEVRRLKLDVGDFGELVVVKGKGDKDRVVPMGPRLNGLVSELLLLEQLDPKDHLWYSRPGGGRKLSRDRVIGDGSFDRWWQRCLKDAGVRYRNPHVARHTFATRWLRRGGRLETLSLVMGHASIQTTADLYAHLDTRDIAVDVAAIGKVEA